jgi:nicotinamidase-related amidase
LPRVLPRIVRLREAQGARTVVTRFLPAVRPGQGVGKWRTHHQRWGELAMKARGRDLFGPWPELAHSAPPASVVDKPIYAPWLRPNLRARLEAARILIARGETDMCVLSTVLGAIDWGYRTSPVTDCVCSASDEARDATLDLFSKRCSQHVEERPLEKALEALS